MLIALVLGGGLETYRALPRGDNYRRIVSPREKLWRSSKLGASGTGVFATKYGAGDPP